MSDKNVHQLQWKQKNSDQSIYPSRNANIQSTSPIANQQPTAAASASIHPSLSGTASNGRYPIIGSQQQVVTSPASSISSTNTSIGLQQHFHTMQHLQQQQQQQHHHQQQQQQQQQQHHHPHQQNPHFELSKIMAMNSGALSRLELPPTLGNHPVSSAITENVLSLIGRSSIGNSSNTNSDDNKIPDEEKLRRVQAIVESGIGDHAKQQILQILDRISTLKPVERLLLYLRMPGETPESDPLRQPQNPLGTRSEINHTINWVRSHLEHDPKVSIPKQDVYNDYIAYCERLDIKPLSTADFGKVMKQVFPEIRPRRLGTRGHSRYCYAAMRKTTKLTPPQLPTIGGRTVDTMSSCEIECDPDAESWNTVRTWAEGLLNAKFDSLKDLADHIGKNEYLGGGAGSSRVLLQKKLLQRDAKEKRVYADSGPLKKRRKKKRKGSTSSESSSTTQHASLNEPAQSNEDILLGVQTIKQEILDSPNSLAQMHLHLPSTPYDTQMHGHQLLPMNLASTESERSKTLGGLLPINSPVAKNLSKTIADLPPSVSLLPIDPQTAQLASVKEEIINDEYNPQNVICKKVRRAHLTKGILPTNNPPSSTITTAEAMPAVPHVELSPADVSNYPMGPPAQITTTAMESAKLASQVRARKLRLLQAHNEMYQTYDAQQQQQQQANIQQAQPLMDNVEITEDKDVVLPENLGLPRERVISICNMDKHELDDYLNANDEDNSQDQEAELIQYFQTGDAENNNNNNNNNKATLQQQQHHQHHHQQQQQQPIDANNPTLAEYNSNSAFQVNNNNNSNKKKSMIGPAGGCYTRDRDDITQLRNYLHQNFNKDSNETMGALAAATATLNQRANVQGQKFQPNGNHYNMPGVYNEGSASASLAIMSQKHLNETASPSIAISAAAAASLSITTTTTTTSVSNATLRVNHSILPVDDYTPVPNNMRATQKRKINLNAMVPAPSTTQRRKNCTFFPISPNINLTNTTTNNSNSSSVSCASSMSATTTNTNLFASPRLTASLVRTKPTLHKQQSLPAADKTTIASANDPMIGANRNNRNYSTITSASAPPSPSILQDTMMFGKNYNTANPMSGYNPLLSNQDYQQAFANTNKILTNDQNSLESVLDEPPPHLMAESRSRSVPLQYCNSPAFNQTANYAGFSSTCNSAAQTPVPPQFADFSDPSSILDIFSDASQTHGSSIKMDESSGSLLCGSVADILPPEYGRIPANSFGAIASRSVPSTPLPLHNMIDPFLGNSNSNIKKHQQKQDNFSSAQSKYSTKMYDISKSMPTTPITSNTATPSFRYSPEFNRDFLINGNTVESTPAYSRAPSVAGATAPSLSDSLLDDAREGGSNSLTDGMDDLGSFGEVSESIIEADILNMNNL